MRTEMCIRDSIYIVTLIMFVSNFVMNMGVNVYYFTYVARDVSKMGIISAIQMIGIPAVIIFPAVIKRFSTAKLMFVGCFVSAFGYAINFFAGGNMVLLGIAAVCYGAVSYTHLSAAKISKSSVQLVFNIDAFGFKDIIVVTKTGENSATVKFWSVTGEGIKGKADIIHLSR